MGIYESKFYCIVEYKITNGIGRTELFTESDLETISGIQDVCKLVKDKFQSESAIIILIQKLK